MTYQNFDTILQNANISYVMASGPYKLELGSSQRISNALVFAVNLDELIIKKIIAQDIYNNNYRISEEEPFTIIYPTSKDTISGEINITWSKGNCSDRNTIARIYLSKEGEDFEFIGENSTNSGSFSFNTNDYPDGILYKLKIISHDGSLCGQAETSNFFVINNIGNSEPQFRFLEISKEKWKENQTRVQFISGDPDGDKSTISLYYGTDKDFKYAKSLFLNQKDTTKSFLWNTTLLPNSAQYYLFGKIQNDNDTVIVRSEPFAIDNDRNMISGSDLIMSRESKGTGNFYLSLINHESVQPNDYRIEFVELEDSTFIGYNLFDITNSEYVYENAELGLNEEGSIFNGISISIYDDTLKQVIDSLTLWLEGECNILLETTLDESSPERNIYWPEDFRLSFMSDYNYITPFFNLVSNLKITTATDSISVDYEIFDNDGNRSLSIYDEILLIKDLDKDMKLTWRLRLLPPAGVGITPILPTAGDVFQIVTSKQFKAGDKIIFRTDTIVDIEENDRIPDRFELKQNYPNPFNPTTTIKYSIPSIEAFSSSKNGDTFVNLSVFDLLGRKVKTLVSNRQKSGSYEIKFNGANLTSGIYFYQLKVGKVVISKKMILLK